MDKTKKVSTLLLMENILIIDLGTNTAIFTVLSKDNSKLIITYEQSITTRIGENISSTNNISKEVLERNMSLINKELEYIRSKFNISNTYAMTTEALRCAVNGQDCIKELNDNCGIEFEIITGEKEAMLTEKALHPLTSQFPNRVICDIGGGSTELIFIESNTTKGYKSIPLGVLRIEKDFKVSSNPKAHTSAILGITRLLGPKKINTNALILCGGTATTTASILLGLNNYDAKKVEGYVLKREELEALILKVSKMNLKDLRELLITDKARADVITAGFLIIRELINHFNPTTIMISTYGPRHGFVMEKLAMDEVIQ